MLVTFGHHRFGVQKFGGITRYFIELARELNALESVRAEIFCPIYMSPLVDPALLAWPGGYRVQRIPGTGPAIRMMNLFLAETLGRLRPCTNVYHETYYSRFDCAPRGAARVVTVFDMIHELFPESFSSFDRTRQIKAKSIARADHVICISEQTRSDLIRITGCAVEKTSVVHLGNSFGRAFSVAQEGFASRPYLLYVGQRSGYKNFRTAVRAYAESPRLRNDFQLKCFGGGAFSRDERRLFADFGLDDDSVHQVDGGDELLYSAYSNATMLVYPSLYEGFGLPPLEAMSVGCPVVCAASSSIPEVVQDAGEYFDPLDFESIRFALERVAGSPSRQRELRLRGFAQSSVFSWAECARRTLDVYSKVTGDTASVR